MKKNAGFTLVELIVVIAILGILAGVAVPVYSGYIKKANQAADMTLLGSVNTAFGAACIENRTNAAKFYDGSVDILTDADHKVTGIAINADPTMAAEAGTLSGAINESFKKFFKGNEDTPFKYFFQNDHEVVFKDGAFMDKDVAGVVKRAMMYGDKTIFYTNEGVTAAKNSRFFDGGVQEKVVSDWTGTIDNMVEMVHGTPIQKLLGGDGTNEFKQFLSDNGIDANEDDASLALVSFVAEKLSTVDAAELHSKLEGDFTKDLTTVANMIHGGTGGSTTTDKAVAAAFLYGMAGAYSNSEEAEESGDYDNANELLNNVATISNAGEFYKAMEGIDEKAYADYVKGKNGKVDVEALISMMDMIASNDKTVADFVFGENRNFNNADINGLINELLSKIGQ